MDGWTGSGALSKSALDITWRTACTFLSFVWFGIGILIFSGLILPIIHLCSADKQRAQQTSRRAVHYGFRLHIGWMNRTGVLDYEVHNSQALSEGRLIVANHPSLIDVIFIISQLPDAYCVVKGDLSRNLFTRLIFKATGYVTHTEPDRLIDECVALINSGATIVMFPEGTRTIPGQRPTFRNGASVILCRTLCPLVPVFLTIAPATLAKGEAWFKVPDTKFHYSMSVGNAISPHELIEQDATERQNARKCTQRLQDTFFDRLGADDHHGKPASGHQNSDSKYSRT
jgi:1-acyl-sn-glycerol-3-phosphate acyltransferase